MARAIRSNTRLDLIVLTTCVVLALAVRLTLASLKPPPVNDPLVVEIEKQWTRLSAEYHKSRKVNHYPDRKWRHG